jgi:hypothetical protein
VEPLELPPAPRMIRPSVDHPDAPTLAVAPELLRDEAAPIVVVEGLRLAPTLGGPPQALRGDSGKAELVVVQMTRLQARVFGLLHLGELIPN